MEKQKKYLKYEYFSSIFAGIVCYACYASLNTQWQNPYLVAVCIYFALFLPVFSKLSALLDTKVYGSVNSFLLAKAVRFGFQLALNALLLHLLYVGNVVPHGSAEIFSGFWFTSFLITLASTGIQYLAEAVMRIQAVPSSVAILTALTVSILINALAVSGVEWVRVPFVALGYAAAIAFLVRWSAMDGRLLLKQMASK